MAVVSFGDIHFDDSRPWSQAVAKSVIDSIDKNPLNNSDNIGVFLGDLTEKSFISGSVYSMLMNLFLSCRFKKVYILVGNHDGRLNAQRKVVLVYNFLKSPKLKEKLFSNFEIISEPTALQLEGMDFLFLPHIFNNGKRSLKEFEHLPDELAKKRYTAIFGHFTSTFLKVPGEKIDVSYLDSKYWCFGHIHNPTTHYQGSYVPNSIAEAGQVRQIRSYSSGVERIDIAPNIVDYYNVKFPDPLPETSAEISVFTVYNCRDEEIAKEQYPGIYIRRCIFDISLDSEDFDKISDSLEDSQSNQSIRKSFEEFVATLKLKDGVKELAMGYLDYFFKAEETLNTEETVAV